MFKKSGVLRSAGRATVLCLAIVAANCSGKTYSTFFQPFDLVFNKNNSAANSTDYVELTGAQPMTTTRVRLTFDEPVTLTAAQTLTNYSIPGLQVLAAIRDASDSRIVYLDTSPQTPGNAYTVTVTNVTGIDGSQMSTSANRMSFTAPQTADKTAPEFSTVAATASTKIFVTFNEALDLSSSQATANYSLFTDNTCTTGSGITISAAVRQTNQAQVELTTSALGAGPYYLRANGVQDQWGNGTTNLCSAAFTGYTAPAGPKLNGITQQSPTAVIVTFNEDMNMSTGNILANGSYTFGSCGTVTLTTAGVTTVNARAVLLTLSAGGTPQNTPCVLTIPGGANLYGTSGVNLDAGSRTITFNYSSAADSTPPQVASVAPVDTNTIRVTFNEPMSAGSISTSSPFSDFSISPSTTITGVTCNGPPVTYCDVDVSPDQSTQTYSVTVQNMTDVAGNDLATTTTSYTGDGRPYIVAITPLDSTHVLVQWSEPIGNAASVGTADYTINLNPGPGTLNITGASLYPTCTDPCSSAYVMLTTAAQTGGSGYTLQVNNPTGSVDNTLPVGNETSATIPGGGGFTGSSGSSAPTVTSASSPASTTVVVNFSEPIDNASIDTTDFAFNVGCPLNGITPTSAVQVSSGVIQLTMPAQAADGACTVTVTGVRDLLENNIAGSNTATFNYLGTTTTGGPGGDTTAPSVVGVYAASNTQIIVSFSEPVTAGTGGNIANYNFSPSLPGASVSCTGAVCTVTVPAGVQSATTYSLTIAGIQDNATPTPNTMASTTVTFGGIGSGGSTAPTMYFAQLVSPQILEVSFSEAMDLSSSQNTAYYTITPASPAQTISSVVRQSDPSKVRITFSPGAYGSGNSFTVTGTANIRDVSLTALTSPMSATFNGFAGAPAVAPDLAATSDTGPSNSDNITNPFPTPGLTFTGTGTPGDTVVLYQNGVAVATAVVNALGNYSVTQATSPGSGTFTYTVATVSPTGVVSSPSLGLNVVVDSAVPANPATAPTLAAASDTGISNSDAITNLTSNMTVTGTITADATYAQEVDLYDGATLVTTVSVAAGQTTYTFSNLSFTPGAHALTVKVRDIANNSSAAASPTLNLSVDTTAPTLGVTNVVGSNAYIDLPFSEGLYSTSTPPAAAIVQPGAFTITNTGAITVSIQCIKTTTAVGCGAGNDVVAGTSTVRAFLSITGTVTGTESITINSVSTAVFDNAGNAASVTTGAKSLNAVGVPNITGTPTYTSTGATTGYFTVTWDEAPYTNTAASGVLVAGDFTVTFTKNSGNANSASITGFQNGAGGALATGDTTMRILVSFDAATSGVETLQLNAASGQIFSGINPYQNSPTTEQIGPTTAPDALAPNAPASLDLADADDNGLINNDNITTATSGLTISGTAEANSTVRLYQPNTGGTLLATTTADGTGNWQTDIALAAGSSYTVVATARDAALNVSAASSALTITVDGTNPTAPTGVSVPTYTTTTTTNVSFTAGTDTNITTSNVKMCTANDCNTGCVGATTGNSPVAVGGLIDGTSYYGCVQSRDLAGLTSAWVASAGTVTVDTTNPTVASGVSVPSYTTTTSANVTFTAGTDTNITTSNVKMCTANDCTTGCVGATTGNSPTSVGSLSNGTSYYGCVQSRDLAGNTSAWTASGTTVVVDTTNPTVPTALSVPSYSNTTSASVTFTAGTDTNITTSNVKMCTANDCTTGCVGATTGNSPVSVSGLTNGTSYYGCVQSRDLAGNTSAWVATGTTVVIDTTNPTAPTGVTVPTYTNTTSANVTFTAGTDTNITTSNVKMCTANDCTTGCVGATTGNSPTSVGSLVNGTAYYGCVQSRDLATNTSAWVASAATVTVDTTNPTAASAVSVPSYTTTTSANVTFTAGTDTNITTSNVKMCTANDCTTGCVGATTGNSPTSVSSLVDGTSYYGCVQSRDLAGNTAAWVASGTTVVIDATNPTVPTGVTVPTYANATSAAITFTAGTDTNITTSNVKMCTSNDCSTGCVGATTGNSPATVSGLSNATAYYGCVQSVDLAGRTSAWVASAATVTIDTTNPTAPTGVTVPSYTNTTSAAITFTAGTDTNITTSNLKMCTGNDCSTGCVGATTGNTGTSISGLTNGTAYYGCVQSRDLATNTSAWVASAATVTVDTTAPTISSIGPAANSYRNNTQVSYTIDENCAAGAGSYVRWTHSGGSADGSSPHTAQLTGTELTAGTKTNITLANAPTLVSGAIYTVSFSCTDAAGNAATVVSNANITYDTTLPVISAVSPTANFSNTNVSYTLSEVCQSGSITWTRSGGTADGSSPHNRALTGSELNAGTFTGTITNNPTLVDGTIYDITWNCTDLAGNVAATVTQANLTYSPGNLVITGAETLDTDNDGKIDTYRLSFNKPVKDDSFPGYSANALGSVTTAWLVAGYTNVRLIHGTHLSTTTSGAYTDTANDAVLYLRFDENVQTCSSASQVGCDTDAKPDLTTTAAPLLQDFVQTSTLAQMSTGTVTESDGSKPVLIAARSLSTTTADAIFSEPVDTTTAQTATNYVITGGSSPTVSAATRDGTNTNIVHLTTGTQTGGQAYTLTVNTNVKDLANLSMNSSANTANFTGVQNPVVSSVVTTSATTLTITFNETVTAASTECASTAACAAIYDNTSIPILSAVSTAGSGNNSATYTLTVNPMVEGQSYTVTVLQNTVTSVATGNKMLNTNNSATFNGDGKPAASIVATDTKTQCETPTAAPATPNYTRVVVQYDQTVSATATTLANYKITGCVTGTDCASGTGAPNANGAAAVTDKGGNKFWVDFTGTFDTDTSQYQLTISGVQDTNGNTIATPGTMSFRCGDDSTPPGLIAATVVTATAGSTVVLLTFSEAVDNVTANVATNYKYDSAAYGTNVLSAARQSNQAQVLVTFQPALSNGGHQIRVQNVKDQWTPTGNTIVDNGVGNVQPIIVNAPTGFVGGPIFNDPFGDGTTAGTIVIYDQKLYLGADSTSSKLFEMNFSLTSAQTITLDADGTFGTPYSSFNGYATKWSGCASITYPGTPCTSGNTISGVDTIYAACVGGTSTPSMTGSACTTAGGTERMYIGALNTQGNYRSFWHTSTKSSSSTVFPFTEEWSGDTGGGFAYRSLNLIMFKDQLFVNFGAEQGGGGRGGRVCMNSSGCADGSAYLGYTGFPNMSRLTRIGAQSATTGAYRQNGSLVGATGYSGPGDAADTTTNVLNAITVMYEHDNDGTGSNESQLYLANGGYYGGALGSARTTTTDGGIVRTILSRSSKSSLPLNCPAGNGCSEYYEDITPDSLTKWNTYLSIPLPQNSSITGSANCSTSLIEMDCVLPYNIFVPALKAIPYMRTAPNGDLYMLRNACSTTNLNRNAKNGAGGFDFRTERQVCPKGYEIPQLWMLPKNCGNAAACAAAWQLVAEYNPGTPSGKTNMAANTGSCGTAPNKCLNNTHVTLLEFVGNYMYVGWDNATDGANVWRVDMSGVAQGSLPAQTNFSIVNLPGIETGSGGTNQKIFSHVTINDAGKDWLIIITRDGSNAMKIYRTANDQT